jgi:hypothetical protein
MAGSRGWLTDLLFRGPSAPTPGVIGALSLFSAKSRSLLRRPGAPAPRQREVAVTAAPWRAGAGTIGDLAPQMDEHRQAVTAVGGLLDSAGETQGRELTDLLFCYSGASHLVPWRWQAVHCTATGAHAVRALRLRCPQPHAIVVTVLGVALTGV